MGSAPRDGAEAAGRGLSIVNLGTVTLGVLEGLVIGMLAVGVVLVYRSNRFLNLAQGQLGALSALLLGKFVIDWGWSYWLAFPVCLGIGVAVGVAADRWVVRRLRAKTSSTVALLLVSLGISQVLLALLYIKALRPNVARLARFGYPLPFHAHWTIGGVVLGGQYVMIVIACPLVVGALAVVLRYSLIGKMIRAAAGNPDAARVCGISPTLTSAVTWGIAGGLSAIGAILQAPSTGGLFNPALLGPPQLFVALGAAALGAFSSIPLALAGGLALGLADQLTQGMTSNAGTARLVVFALVLAVIFARGRLIAAVFATDGAAVEDIEPLKTPPVARQRLLARHHVSLLGGASLFVAVLLPLLPVLRTQGERFQLSLILVYAIVAVSLTMVTGWGGQLSLGQFAVVGVGAYVAARLSAHGFGIVPLFLASGVAGAVVLVLVALPALRIRGFTLAVTTLGFAIVAAEWLFRSTWFTASASSTRDVSAPSVLPGILAPRSFLSVYYIALVSLAVLALGARSLRRSLPGGVMIAVRDNERVSATYGVTPATVKLATLAVSGFFAGIAGVLWADAWRTVQPLQFDPAVSLALVALPVIGGLGSVGGAIAAAVLIYFPAYFVSPHLGIFGEVARQAGFALGLSGLALIVVLLRHPTGLAGSMHNAWQRFLDRLAEQLSQSAPELTDAVLALDARNVAVTFGGVRALDGASVSVRPGEIVGLIGPNGAGKSTLINVISGAQRAPGGSVILHGRDISNLPPEVRAAGGLGRTFQAAHLFPGLTVHDTVQTVLAA
ncbi:MAG TPA: ATP-binding cassette domain-containing protein, partial [Actinomycetota bacterium]|nr:ATP-binding cassette domain-containing protein [Actinomycetota bacterium]